MPETSQNKFTPILYCFTTVILLFSCTKGNEQEQMDKWKEEIRNTEKAFAEMAAREGIDKAFLAFASDDAVLMRNNKIVKGKSAIAGYFEYARAAHQNGVLVWEPEYVEVSKSGDLGYTYGPYTFTLTDSLGNKKSSEGIFHTIWKKQPDGSWKYVWD